MAFIKGIAISGDYVNTLKDKHFIILRLPIYETYKNPQTNEETEQLKLHIELVDDKSQLDYYPNKTSQKTMANLFGYDMDKWLGKKALFAVKEQRVGKEDKKVLYVEEAK